MMKDANVNEKVFKIVSIDGGGIKGLYSAKILEQFEVKFGKQLSDCCHMLCGTSTGGLIALAASLKIPMSEVCQFYDEEGPKIFPQFKKHWFASLILRKHMTRGDVKQIFRGGKFSDHTLREALQNIFGDKKIEESNNYLCIPSYTITEARPWVFKKDFGKLDRDGKTRYVDVALATSAAPTFFPMAEIPIYDNKQFIDGGVWANNPTLVGLIEALKFFVGKDKTYNKLQVLSLSSLSLTGGKPTGLKRQRSFIDWNEELFETSLSGQSFFTNYFMDTISKLNDIPIEYLRIPSATISNEQSNLIRLDRATKDSLDLIRGKGSDTADIYKKDPKVEKFFNEPKL